MGVVGSLPLSPSSLPITKNSDIQNEYSLPLSNENNNKTISIIPDVSNNNTKICHHRKVHENMSPDHLCVKEHPLNDSIGRCSKHARYHHKEVMKHKLQYKKNRQTKRTLNSTHDNIREQLKKHVRQLELKQDNLLSQVQKLYLYKEQLEIICRQASLTHELIE